jgi:hypothetical protein
MATVVAKLFSRARPKLFTFLLVCLAGAIHISAQTSLLDAGADRRGGGAAFADDDGHTRQVGRSGESCGGTESGREEPRPCVAGTKDPKLAPQAESRLSLRPS